MDVVSFLPFLGLALVAFFETAWAMAACSFERFVMPCFTAFGLGFAEAFLIPAVRLEGSGTDPFRDFSDFLAAALIFGDLGAESFCASAGGALTDADFRAVGDFVNGVLVEAFNENPSLGSGHGKFV